MKAVCHFQVVKSCRQELSSRGTQESKDSRKLRSMKRSDDGRMSELRDKFSQPVASQSTNK
jgi:hypothetical protein